ncbi:MAG: hypothetical protein K1X88_18335 [Nannocystaceae bacterium]|nr:hypothetical protein [Nannocystaceae bacterium]
MRRAVVRGRALRVATRVGLLALSWLGPACAPSLVRLERAGRHDDVIAAADARRWPPRRAQARALARSLVALGREQRARDVLLRDWRRGGQLPSLVALAELEHGLGREGLAAAHFTRVLSVDRSAVADRPEVCALLQTRAQGWVALGEGDAALDDLDRSWQLCGRDDAALRTTATAAAREQLRTRIASALPCEDCDEGPARADASAFEAVRDRARADGPQALRAWAAAHRAELPPADVVALLLAELRGEAGEALLEDDELRRWLGETAPSAFVELLATGNPLEGAYVRLRLERVLGRSPDGGVASPSQRALWADRAAMIPGAVDWRRLALVDDLTGVEQDLVATWRPRARRPETTAAADRDVIAPIDTHWALRVPLDAHSAPALLLLARLRDADGDRELALEIAMHVLRGALAQGLPGAPTLLRDEVERALGWGRPWRALALAHADEHAELAPLRAAAATAVLIEETLCGGPCEDEAADVAAAQTVLGAERIAAIRAELRELATARPGVRARAGACVGLDEALTPGARTPLSRALARARTPGDEGVADAIAEAIESDPTLVCAGRLLLPVMVAHGYRVTARRLSDHLSHVPELRVAPLLQLHAGLAMIAGDEPRAEQLGVAAAARATSARESWRELARVAAATGARDVERLALRESIVRGPGLRDDAARRAMLVAAIEDGWTHWGPRDTPAGRESIPRLVTDALAGLHPSQRADERERLVTALAMRATDDDAIAAIVRAVLPGELLSLHPLAAMRLGLQALPQAPAGSDDVLALQIEARRVAEPPPARAVLGRPEAWIATRTAISHAARDWALRRRLAVGLLVLGDEVARARAAAELWSMASAPVRGPLQELLLDRPSALAAAGAPAPGVVDDDVLLVHVLLALPLDAALHLRDAGAR